jgi:hypothetical protein
VTRANDTRDVWADRSADPLAGAGARRRRAPMFTDGHDASQAPTRTLVATLAAHLLEPPGGRAGPRLRALLWHRDLWQRRAAYRQQSEDAAAQAAVLAASWDRQTTDEATDLILVRLARRMATPGARGGDRAGAASRC